jgi:hypothetical protein
MDFTMPPSPAHKMFLSGRPSPKGKATFITGGDFGLRHAPMSQNQTKRDIMHSLSPQHHGGMNGRSSLPEIATGTNNEMLKEMQREKEKLHRFF